MQGKYNDLTGQRFGRLLVIERAENGKRGQPRWKCKCDCGNETVVFGQCLKTGNTKSCGCIGKEKTVERNTKHGAAKKSKIKRLYRIWVDMRSRCRNENYRQYHLYGGRGISVCDEWRDDYAAFEEWALANGYNEDLTIDRIDVDGDYCPENCRWATAKEQGNNRRSNHTVVYNGKKCSISELAEKAGIPYPTLYSRIKSGLSIEEAMAKKDRRFKN